MLDLQEYDPRPRQPDWSRCSLPPLQVWRKGQRAVEWVACWWRALAYPRMRAAVKRLATVDSRLPGRPGPHPACTDPADFNAEPSGKDGTPTKPFFKKTWLILLVCRLICIICGNFASGDSYRGDKVSELLR